MDKVHFKLNIEELTFDEMIAIQEGNLRQAKTILVKLATDESGKPLPADEADGLIGKLSITQTKALFTEFGEQVQAAMSETLPNERRRK